MYAIVRPFQREVPQSTRRIIASNTKIDVPDAIISWGRTGTLAGAQEIDSIDDTGEGFTVLSCDDRYDEIDRREQTVRIENPDDPNQYIMEARPTYIAFSKLSEWEKANYNKTTTWQTAVATANFSTVSFNNKKCRSSYELKVDRPA